MAIIKCRECGKSYSQHAASCPECGKPNHYMARNRTADNSVRPAYVWIGAIAIGALLLQNMLTDETPTQSKPAYQPIDYDLQQRTARAQAEAISLKFSMRDQDTFNVHNVMTDVRGDTVCISYQARNGFGGMNQEEHISVNGQPKIGWGAWCKGIASFDMTASVR